jgi:hypothetical protein
MVDLEEDCLILRFETPKSCFRGSLATKIVFTETVLAIRSTGSSRAAIPGVMTTRPVLRVCVTDH